MTNREYIIESESLPKAVTDDEIYRTYSQLICECYIDMQKCNHPYCRECVFNWLNQTYGKYTEA